MNEKELLAVLVNDTSQGLECAVRQYTPYVYKIVRTKLNKAFSDEDIEEIITDVFIMFYKYVSKNKDDVRSVKALLAVIARRRCADAFARMSKQSDTVSLDDITELSAEENFNTDRQVLNDALHKLGQPDEEIFIRKYFFGQKSRDIAKDMGMKHNTVDKRISRGLKRLKEILEEGE